MNWQEKSFEMAVAEDGIATYDDDEAILNNLREWCLTPMGTVADWPSWGYDPAPLLFAPQSGKGGGSEILAEISLLQKLRQDVFGIDVSGISVEFIDMGRLRMTLACEGQLFVGEILR